MRRYYDEHELDGDGVPWSDEPVPMMPAGVMAHYACRYLAILVDGEQRIIGPREQLVRHYGRRGGDVAELLPARPDLTGQLPATVLHAEPVKVRSFGAGEGSVRSTSGRYDVFHRRERGPQTPLTRLRSNEQPAGAEGPVEIVYVWDGYREPPAGFPVLGWSGGFR